MVKSASLSRVICWRAEATKKFVNATGTGYGSPSKSLNSLYCGSFYYIFLLDIKNSALGIKAHQIGHDTPRQPRRC